MNKIILLVLSLLPPVSYAGWGAQEKETLIGDASQTIRQFKQNDPTLKRFFYRAVGWAIFPSVSKAGILIGGAHGNGVVYQRGHIIGFSELQQFSVGLQIGGEKYSELIFFADKATLERFKQEKLAIDPRASSTLAQPGAAASMDYREGIAVFTLPRGGLMAEVSIGDLHFSFEPR